MRITSPPNFFGGTPLSQGDAKAIYQNLKKSFAGMLDSHKTVVTVVTQRSEALRDDTINKECYRNV